MILLPSFHRYREMKYENPLRWCTRKHANVSDKDAFFYLLNPIKVRFCFGPTPFTFFLFYYFHSLSLFPTHFFFFFLILSFFSFLLSFFLLASFFHLYISIFTYLFIHLFIISFFFRLGEVEQCHGDTLFEVRMKSCTSQWWNLIVFVHYIFGSAALFWSSFPFSFPYLCNDKET